MSRASVTIVSWISVLVAVGCDGRVTESAPPDSIPADAAGADSGVITDSDTAPDSGDGGCDYRYSDKQCSMHSDPECIDVGDLKCYSYCGPGDTCRSGYTCRAIWLFQGGGLCSESKTKICVPAGFKDCTF